MIFYKKQSYVEVISTNEDYYEILYKHMQLTIINAE